MSSRPASGIKTSSPVFMRQPSNMGPTAVSSFEVNAVEKIFRPKKDLGLYNVAYGCEPSQLKDSEATKTGNKNKTCMVNYQNNYRIETLRFPSEKIEPVIQKILEDKLSDEKYDAARAGVLCKELAEEIKKKTLALNFPRFKIVACVNIGEKGHQGIRVASRCIWDNKRDNYGSATFSNHSLFAIGSVYATYYE